jgi:hypothetical protein
MTKCARCKKRKAKRSCPALGDSLCSLCCGLIRDKEIHCPSNCNFLVQHKPYQEKKIIEKKPALSRKELSAEEDLLQDERMAWLVFHIEAPLKEYGEKKESFSDREAILALEYAKERIEKERGLVFLPGKDNRPKNEVGEAILQSIENCRYERKIILPGTLENYKKEEKIKCLERVILSVKLQAKGNFDGRNYIQNLLERFAKIKTLASEKKIITLS